MSFLAIGGLIVFISCILFMVLKFISDIVSHKRAMTTIKQWCEFNKQTLEWSNEIKDNMIRVKYLDYIANEMVRVKSTEFIKYIDIESKKAEIYTRWGSHIPSLVAEIRDKKIRKLLK